MSATAVVEIRSRRAAKRRQRKRLAVEDVRRVPSDETFGHITRAAKALLRENFNYEEAVNLFRVYYIRQGLAAKQGNRSHAAEDLGISRRHLAKYFRRGAELLR